MPNSKPPDVTEQAIADTSEPTRPPRKHRLRWLVLAHVAIGLSVGLLVAWVRADDQASLTVAGWGGVVLCQTSLLGIWGALGTNSSWQRFLGVVVGSVYLGTLLGFGLGGHYADTHLILSLAVGLVVGVLLIVRCFRVRIRVPAAAKTALSRFQFSIRQLLILTAAVACIISLGRCVEPHVKPVSQPFLATVLGTIWATVGLVSIWPVLGTRRPILPGMIATGLALGLGFSFVAVFPSHVDRLYSLITITSIEALSLHASLLVVRSCGYRLVRLPAAGSRNGPGDGTTNLEFDNGTLV